MGLGEDKKVILQKYGPYVRSLASQVRRQFSGSIEMDELVSYGQVGLLEAADRFDPKVGANFLTFAHYRIKGAIFDGLRKMGVLKGAEARGANVGDRAAAFLGNLADRDMGGGGMGSVDDDVRDISSAVTGLAMVFGLSEAAEGADMSDTSMPADQRIEMEQMRIRVRAAMEKLPEKERKLLQGYYFGNKTLEEAGKEIGQSKSWASRLHARAIEELKQLLEEEDDDIEGTRRHHHGGSVGRRDLSHANRAAKDSGPGPAAGAQGGRVKV